MEGEVGGNRIVGGASLCERHPSPMHSEIIFVVSDSPEGGFEARALGHSIYTEADTADELREMVRDAVACHFDGAERPSVIRLHLVREEVLAA